MQPINALLLLALILLPIGLLALMLIFQYTGRVVPKRELEREIADKLEWKAIALRQQSVIDSTKTSLEDTALSFQLSVFHALDTHFSLSELQDLCYNINVPWDELGGKTKTDKAREIVEYLSRRSRISDLLNWLRINRRDVWLNASGTKT